MLDQIERLDKPYQRFLFWSTVDHHAGELPLEIPSSGTRIGEVQGPGGWLRAGWRKDVFADTHVGRPLRWLAYVDPASYPEQIGPATAALARHGLCAYRQTTTPEARLEALTD